MSYAYLITATLFVSFCGIGATYYNRINRGKKDTTKLYNLITLAVVFLCWLVKFLLNPEADLGVIPYSLTFTLGYTSAMIFEVMVYREGPLMLSSLIMQLSMIATPIWGFFFWNTPVTPPVIGGLILVVISLWLCLYNGKVEGEKRTNTKWLIFIAVYFVGNSIAAITQRTQQIDFDSAYGDFLMVVATAISLAVCIISYSRSDKSDSREILKKSAFIPFLVGAANFLINLLIIILATSELSPSLIYPVIAVGSLSVNTVFSVFLFKEKMRWWQWIGVAVGAVAITLLSI